MKILFFFRFIGKRGEKHGFEGPREKDGGVGGEASELLRAEGEAPKDSSG